MAIDSTYMYVAGYDSSDNWRIEKRALLDGSADTGAQDALGPALAVQDTAMTASTRFTPFRLRLRLNTESYNMATSSMEFKLQYAVRSGTCDISFIGESYVDVSGENADFQYYNNSKFLKDFYSQTNLL